MVPAIDDVTAINREITSEVIIQSKPFQHGSISQGARSTIIKFYDGTLLVVSPIKPDKNTKEYISTLGHVKYLVAPDIEHYLYVPVWKEFFPEAEVIGVEGHDKLVPKVKWDFLFTPEALDKSFGPNEEVQLRYFPGFKNKDLAILHKPSRSLIQADLLMNLPATESYSTSGRSASSGFVNSIFIAFTKPSGFLQRFFYGTILTADKTLMARDVKIVNEWDFDRIIPCHGDVIESGGKKVWKEYYSKYLVT